MNVLEQLRRRIAPTADEEEADPLSWRERVLFALLAMSLILGTLSGVPSMMLAYRDGMWLTIGVDLTALIACWILTLHPRISFAWRAGLFLGIAYAVGVYFLLAVGLVSQIYLMAVPILTALLMGLRPSILALLLVSATLGFVGYFFAADLPMGRLADAPRLKFTLIALNFLFVDATLTISVAVLMRWLERSLERERKSATSRDRLAGAVAQALEGIILCDRDGRVDYANAAAARLLAGATQLHFEEIESESGVSLAEAMRVAGAWRGTVRIPNDSETPLECELTVSPLVLRDPSAGEFVAILRDVTHERRLEERLRRGEKLEALGTLSGGIAHDFNNIIGSILAVAEVERLSASGPQAEALERIAMACRRARDIVRQMMAFSRQEVRSRRPQRLAAVVSETLPLLRASIPATISFQTELGARHKVAVDAAEVHQVLLNLGTNAAQAMASRESGTLFVSVRDVVADDATRRIWPSAHPGETYVELSVRDTGVGIPRRHLDRIFDPFFTTKQPSEGTGLGLASVHGIVRSLGGEIQVESVEGQGTEFRILLPTVEEESASGPRPVRGESPTRQRWQGVRALVVDDEPVLRHTLQLVLQRAGFDVRSAEDAGTALDLLRAEGPPIQLLLTDLSLPGGSGLAIIRAARERSPETRSILISGYSHEASEADATVKPDAFLQKPFEINALLATVEQVMA
ncbi:ATP-binding protein [Pseudogemmatithrix spongiicola]|uniref:histidine kinase n=1 Tax=Pseudogemmatithrix spongiicola TaxID=3062599 RepID=A0AA49JVX4_9BACT|nr:ATP-binding protein [Gemmatimonadaceae bacterium 'strain 138']WKW16041.1 ATP-binding protein [Gemmatimonadaceae bacterium 'strain 318']